MDEIYIQQTGPVVVPILAYVEGVCVSWNQHSADWPSSGTYLAYIEGVCVSWNQHSADWPSSGTYLAYVEGVCVSWSGTRM